MKLGKTIKDIRRRRGMTQKKLAFIVGISRTSLSQIENGVRPGKDTLKDICDALHTPESLLYTYSMEREDVPAHKQEIYDTLFPIIQEMILTIVMP